MVLVWFVILSAAQVQPGLATGIRELAPRVKQCANGAKVLIEDTCPLNLPDHRTQFTINPLEIADTREWKCAKDGISTRWSVKTRDVSAPNRNETFKSELIELMVDGRPANSQAQRRVRAALTQFNTSPLLKAGCVGRIPVIRLDGSRRNGSQYEPLRVEVPLR